MVEVINYRKNIETFETKTDFPSDRYKESQDFSKKHLTLKQKVLSIVKTDKLARKDYFWLCLLIWIKSNHIKFVIPMESYSKMYKPESISRVFRELVEEAKKGKPELQFLLNDKITLNKRDNLKELNKEYFQAKNLGEEAELVK